MPADFYYFPEDWDLACSTAPVRVRVESPLSSITANGSAVCGLTTVSRLVCWGYNGKRPQAVSETSLSAAWTLETTVCGVGDSGVSCWGLWGRDLTPFPVTRPFGDDVTLVSLAGNSTTSCGLARDALPVVYCWGGNYTGQAGDGSTADRRLPVRVALPQ